MGVCPSLSSIGVVSGFGVGLGGSFALSGKTSSHEGNSSAKLAKILFEKEILSVVSVLD